MTIKRFFVILVLQWAIFSVLKYYFFGSVFFENLALQYLLFWISTIFLAVILVRKLGVINYFEGVFIAILWFVVALISDLIVLTNFVGYGMYSKWQFWAGYLLMALAVFLFHKKRHVEIRKQHQQHPAHH